MRKLLITSFGALLFILSATGGAAFAHANALDSAGATGEEVFRGAADNSSSGSSSSYVGSSGLYASQAEAQAAAERTVNDIRQKEGEGYGKIMTWIASLFAWLVGVAALTLDFAVFFTVIKMGDYVHNLAAIGVAWRILRDVGNILLIFGFLAIGLSVIVNAEWFGFKQKMLPMLLVAAVFINFSLFFTQAVIDVGNMFATQFFTQINGGVQPTAEYLTKTTTGTEGISNKIMAQVGLQGIYGEGEVNTKIFEAGPTWMIGFMAILLFIVTAFVMFSLAFILISRFVFLIFLIILAPLGFAGLAVPQLAGRAKWWWDSLFKQTITAPVLLLLLYVALAVITDANFLTGFGAASPNAGSETTWVGFIDGRLTGFGSLLLSFLIAMGLLLFVTIAAKGLSAVGATGATKLAGKLSFGTTAWLGRTTVGWGANRAGKYLKRTRFARMPLVGTGIVKGLDKVASGSFDVRGATLGGGLKGMKVDAGDAQKGGYKADLKARIESRTKYASELKGKDLNEEEKIQQAMLQRDVATMEKLQQRRKMQQAKNVEENRVDDALNAQIVVDDEKLKRHKEKLDALESQTDKGSKLKYAKALNLWMDEKNTFNKYFNFAANTEAAKKIREEAKKSKDDQTLDQLKKALKKAGGEEEPPAAPPAGGAPAAGGGH